LLTHPPHGNKWIHKGDILGILHDPDVYFNLGHSEDQSKKAQAIAAIIQKIVQGPLGERDLTVGPFSRSKEDFLAEPDGPEDLWGPKTSGPPDPTTHSSKDLESLVDIAADAPEKIHELTIKLLKKHIKAFRFDNCLGSLDTKATICLKEGSLPISVPMYRASPAKCQFINKQMHKWIHQEVIEPSSSPWAAPVVIVYHHRKPCFCVDYCKLNSATIPDEFPIPCQCEILQALLGAQVLSAVDALSGFHQRVMQEEDVEKTAFHTHRGLWQFKQLPFGL
jgi:hypothetical protein